MKNLYNIIPLFLIFCLYLQPVMAQDNDHRDIFEGKVDEAPLNPVLRQVVYKGTEVTAQDLRSHSFDFNAFTMERKAFKGNHQLSGTLSLADKGMLRFVDDQQQSIQISYNVPDNLEFTQGYKIENALLELNDNSDPGMTAKKFVVMESNALSFGFVWKTDAEPVEINFKDKISLKQEPIDLNEAKPGYYPVTVKIETDSGSTTLKAGESKTVIHNGKTYMCYVQQSTYLTSDDDGGCSGGGYILHAMLSRR